MTAWITSLLRKLVFAGAATWIAKIVDSGVLSQGQLDAWLEASIALAVALVMACWSKWILPWIQSKIGQAQ